MSAAFVKDGAHFEFESSSGASRFGLKFKGSSTRAIIQGGGQIETVSNYLLGDDPSQWHTGVRHFSSVRYEEIYDGIAAVFHGNGERLEYDFEVGAGADPRIIEVLLEGATNLRIDENGELRGFYGSTELRHHKPVVYL